MVVQVDYTESEIRYDLITGSGDDPYEGLDRFDRVIDCVWENYGDSVDAARIQYGYDRVSNRTWRENPVDPNRRYDQLYSYDGLYRLTDFQQGELNSNHDGINDENFRQAWNIDATGNWSGFNQDDDGDTTWDLEQSREANKVNEITEIDNAVGPAWIEPVYDKAGNMVVMPQPDSPTDAFLATYDAWNRLVRISTPGDPDPVIVAEYQYDGRTFRTLAKEFDAGTLDHVRHLYYSDAWQALEERLDSSTDADRQYVWGIRYIDDLVLRDRDASNPPDGTLSERLYSLQDDNWNVIAICDDEGDVQERFEYQAYGKPVFLTGGFGVDSGSGFDWKTLFAGYRTCSSSRLQIARNRDLHPVLGGWLSRDPAGYFGSRPSLYSYCLSNPLAFIDPLGFDAIRIFIHTENMPAGYNWREVHANLRKMLDDAGLECIRVSIHLTERELDRTSLGMVYDRTSWGWNSGWWNLHPLVGLSSVGNMPFYYGLRDPIMWEQQVRWRPKTPNPARGAIASTPRRTVTTVNTDVLAAQLRNVEGRRNIVMANLLAHEILHIGLCCRSDPTEIFSSNEDEGVKGTIESATAKSQSLSEISDVQADRIRRAFGINN